jgi:dienelactone hydrolase
LSKFKHKLLPIHILFLALTANVYAAERAFQVILPVANLPDISLHVFTPSNTPKGVLIALHGCGGLLSTNTKNGDKLSSRHAAMAQYANALGWVAVFPDSFTTRGRREICTQKFSERTIKQTQRKADALATAEWVKAQEWMPQALTNQAQPKLKSVLLGWSNGGSTVLETIESPKSADAAYSNEKITTLIDQAVAFYPGCSAQLARHYRTKVPLTLFIGGLDDWTPPQPCIALGHSVDAQVYVYPEAHHGFDSPSGKVRLRKEVPNGVNPGQGVHVGPHPDSRDDAYKKLQQLLEQLSVSVR